MLDRLEPSALLVTHLQYIHRVARKWCRQNRVWGEEVEDFTSQALMKLMEDDYAVFRKFRGECPIKNFLAVVVVQRLREHARERWGRWRHSAEARRLGELSMDLETLVYRDGYTLREACEVMRTRDGVAASDAELAKLFAQLPVRKPLRPLEGGAEPLDWLAGTAFADDLVRAEERRRRCRAVMEAVRRALARMSEEDRMIVRMRFAEERKVKDVAFALGVEYMPLFKRIDRLRARLRDEVVKEGGSEEDARECLEKGGDADAGGETGSTSPS